jgi:hypothetical protein
VGRDGVDVVTFFPGHKPDRRRVFTDEQLREQAAAGYTATEASRNLKCDANTISTHASRLGITFRRARRTHRTQWDAERDELVGRWSAGELTTRDAMRQLTCSLATLRRRCLDLGQLLPRVRYTEESAAKTGASVKSAYARKAALGLEANSPYVLDAAEPGERGHDRPTTVHTLGRDPYLAALRSAHPEGPREDIYPGLKRQTPTRRHLELA